MRIARLLPLSALLFVPQVGAAKPAAPAKVVLIGIDGVSLNLLEPYVEAGVTPNLGKLVKGGARGHLASVWPLRTPQVWTSVVTGKLPGQHGIWDHVSDSYYNPPEIRTDARTRVTSEHRKSKALWNLLGDAGLRTLTVGWMASWPAETVPQGVMVAPIELVGDKRQTTIKGSFYSDAPRMVSPAKYEKDVRGWITDPDSLRPEDLKPFADVPPSGSPLYDLPFMERYVYALSWSLARARSVERVTLELARRTRPDVVLSYFQCPDSLLHRFWIFHRPVEAIAERLRTHGIDDSRAAELHQRFGRVVDACYRDVDERVGRILSEVQGPDTLVLVVSDHGFGPAPVPHRMKDEPYSGDHLDDGVILAAGPGIRPGTILKGATVLDVTPTVLHQLGQPVAEDMRGEVIADLFDVQARGVKTVGTYESAPQREIPYPEGWPPRQHPRRSQAPVTNR